MWGSLEKIRSSTIADVLDGLGIWGVLPPEIIKQNKTSKIVIGRAHTVRWGPVRKRENIKAASPSTWDEVKDFLLPNVETGKGKVYVAGVENGLLQSLALAGGLSTTDFHSRQFEGVILGGAVRDAHVTNTLNLPIWATNYTPADTQGNYRVVEIGTWCRIGEVMITTGDWLLADETGCVVIPEKYAEEVFSKALAIEETEKEIEQRMLRGERLFDVVNDIGRI